MYLKKLFEENGNCLFFQFSFVFFSTACWKNQRQTLCYDVWPLTSLWNLRNPCWKSEWILFLQCFEVLLTFLWGMDNLMASAFNNLTDFLLPLPYYCPFVFFSPNKPEIVRIFSNNLSLVNQLSYPSLAGLTVDWLEYEIFC
jgi:hypothetical protein